MHRIILINKNSLNKNFFLNKSRSFEDILKNNKNEFLKGVG
jgi:hypothetical protein